MKSEIDISGTECGGGECPVCKLPKGRFAPSPSGRMHLGNLFTALVSWLSVKSRGGKWILRIEDLDNQRSRDEYARQIEDDLLWLGLEWDEGGLSDSGDAAPYRQSLRHDVYAMALCRLDEAGLLYPCRCRRADILASQAPHQSDGRVVYAGTCRPSACPPFSTTIDDGQGVALRIYTPDDEICFHDRVFGYQRVNLGRDCGDFVMRRSDGGWAYQLAVVVDDALMGVTEVVRGCDLLLSTAQQLYLYRLLGYSSPEFMHLPLICNKGGLRLSKRDGALNAESLRSRFSPRELIGRLACMAGILSSPEPVAPEDLLSLFSPDLIPQKKSVMVEDGLCWQTTERSSDN